MNTFMLVSAILVSLLTIAELHYKLVQWMNQSSEVFEIEY